MNWLDMIIIGIIAYNIFKGLRLGFVASFFRIVGFILSLYIASKYYFSVYNFIMNNEALYKAFEKLTEFILTIVFYSKAKDNPDFVPGLISDGIVKVIIVIVSAIAIFIIVNLVVNMLLELLSSIFNAPILKQLNKLGGMIFGLIRGFFIVYIISLILTPIAMFFPESLIGEGVYNSLILMYIKDFSFYNMILDYLPIKTYI